MPVLYTKLNRILVSKNLKKMSKNTHNGLPLIRSSEANLEWWLNTSHSKTITRESHKLLCKIHQNLSDGINSLYEFKRFELFKNMEEQLELLMKIDPNAHAIDLRVIFNLPKEKMLNEGYVIKATPYNITYDA